MSRERSLHGGCACGRNIYVIEAPSHSSETAQVVFDNHPRTRHASPLSAYLRVPLNWYRSATQAFFDDESHALIRRVYSSPYNDASKRQFCGYCGTNLSLWTEEPAEEAEYICLSLGTLRGDDLQDLGDLGVLPKALLEDALESSRAAVGEESRSSQQQQQQVVATEGTRGVFPWVESMLEGSSLGRHVRTTRGGGQSADGSVRVQWEVSEWTDGAGTPNSSKRKLEDVDNTDADMEGSH